LKFGTFVTLWVDEIFVPTEDGRNGTFMIGNESFPASLLDLPTVVESYKTYDDSVLIKTADIGQVKVHVYCIPVCNLFIKFHIFKSSSEKQTETDDYGKGRK